MALDRLEHSFNQDRLPEQELNGCDSVIDYHYEPLEPGQIRVVNLFPRQENAQELLSGSKKALCCTIEHVDVLQTSYTAISYEWGNPDQPISILVMDKGENPLRAIRITSTLENVLFDLMQSPIEPKVFWIDQLCINQKDNRDKNIQIPEMGTIYRNASQVLTYLGPAEPTDPEGLKLIDQICRHYEPMLMSLEGFSTSSPITPEVILSLSRLLEQSPEKKLHVQTEKPAWATLCRVIITGWLKRRWMVQENVLNKNTVFLRGPQTFKQADGGLVILYIYYGILPQPTDVALSSAVYHYAYTTGGIEWCRFMKLPMLNLLWWFSQTECYDPRDRIFALLGAASDAPGLNLTVDYERTENEALINLATRMVEYHRNLDVLTHADPLMTGERGLPSWVPYWDTHGGTYASQIGRWPMLNAADKLDIRCAFEDKGKVLTLHGLRLGKLEASLGDWGSRTIAVNYSLLLKGSAIDGVRQQVRVLNQIQERWDNSKDHEYALACTLVSLTWLWQYIEADSKEAPHDGVIRTLRNCVRLLKHALESRVSQSSGNLSHSTAVSSPPSMTEKEKVIALKFMRDIAVRNRAFWTVNDKYLCLAPATAKADDLVTVLFGGRVLYVLRPTKDEGRYVFIGTAYIHGFMQGEAVQSPKWEQERETFRLV